eukprot:1195221-Prorocentrum_minimum.AAC.1
MFKTFCSLFRCCWPYSSRGDGDGGNAPALRRNGDGRFVCEMPHLATDANSKGDTTRTTCQKSFKTEAAATQHRIHVHGGWPSRSVTSDTATTDFLICGLSGCGKRFKTTEALEAHRTNHPNHVHGLGGSSAGSSGAHPVHIKHSTPVTPTTTPLRDSSLADAAVRDDLDNNAAEPDCSNDDDEQQERGWMRQYGFSMFLFPQRKGSKQDVKMGASVAGTAGPSSRITTAVATLPAPASANEFVTSSSTSLLSTSSDAAGGTLLCAYGRENCNYYCNKTFNNKQALEAHRRDCHADA